MILVTFPIFHFFTPLFFPIPLKADIESIRELMRALAGEAPAEAPRAPIAASALSAFAAQNAREDTKSAFDVEFEDYIHFLLVCVTEENAMKMSPLEFFGNHKDRFPLISRIASKIFSAQASQAECERIFSSAGRITTDARNRLNCFHINELS